MELTLRRARAGDAHEIADIYLSGRHTFLPYAPLAHPDDEVRAWVATTMLPAQEVWLAEQAGAALGFVALARDAEAGWIEQLYLRPAAVGRGVGSALLAHALARLGPPVRLYTFQPNLGARRFYERHGFRAIAFGDGTGNEEGCPDVLYEWGGAP